MLQEYRSNAVRIKSYQKRTVEILVNSCCVTLKEDIKGVDRRLSKNERHSLSARLLSTKQQRFPVYSLSTLFSTSLLVNVALLLCRTLRIIKVALV